MLACEQGISELLEMFKSAPEGTVRVINTSFGVSLLCYVGSDGHVHTLIPSDQVDELVRKWDYGPGHMMSLQRFIEVSNLVATVRGQMLGLDVKPAPVVQRRQSDVYVGGDALERRLRGLSWELDGFRLTEEQQNAVKVCLGNGSPVSILTGQAGSGKSAITRWLKENNLATVCATTGRAAINVGGTTVDSLFCFSRGKWQVFKDKVLERYMQQCHKIVLIDEASMIGDKMGTLLITLAERYDKRLVLVGDWAQASPVKEDWGHCSRLFDDCSYVRLEECHRQDETEFLEVLNKVRIGVVDEQVNRVLSSKSMPPPSENGWLRMYATNKMTDTFNQKKLAELCEEEDLVKITLRSKFKDERDPDRKGYEDRTEVFKDKVMDETGFAHKDQFAIGAQVLIVQNQPTEKAYVNGDVGVLIDVEFAVDVEKAKEQDCYGEPIEWRPFCSWSSLERDEKERFGRFLLSGASAVEPIRLVVLLDRTGATVTVEPHTANFVNGGGALTHTVRGFPVRLGYAVTIHKAQGMTVDKAWLDMESIRAMPESGRHGLAYVGLSRVRTLEGLGVGSWAPDVVVCSPEVIHLI